MFKRKVNYYETDQMAIVHHSNYIRWLEEARIEWMDKNGCSLFELEKIGIQIPVVDVYCKYLKPVHFGQTVNIRLKFSNYTGTRFEIEYMMFIDEEDTPCNIASSKHCFIKTNGQAVSLKKYNKEFHDRIAIAVKKEKENEERTIN
ncbi:MAG: acyl-CoA thioesterase [Clostridia bacterium]